MGATDQMKLRRRWTAIGLAGAAVLVGALFYQWRANSIVGPWTDAQGRTLPDGLPPQEALVIGTDTGDSHCDWESAIFLDMAWPPGTVLRGPIGDDYEQGSFRQYLKDPNNVVGGPFATTFDPDAPLPDDARPSGFRRGPWELWVSPSEAEEAVYLVRDGKVERWPRVISRRVIACA